MWQISIDKMSAMSYIIRNRCGFRACVGVMFACLRLFLPTAATEHSAVTLDDCKSTFTVQYSTHKNGVKV